MANRRRAALGYLSALALTLGCLPAGDPPHGRHLVADRTLSAVQFSASEQDGVPAYLLVSGPVHIALTPDAGASAGQAESDLYWIRDEARAPTLPRPLVKSRPVLTTTPQDETVLADSLGRLVVQHHDPDNIGDPAAYQISRLDFADKTVTRLAAFRRKVLPTLRLSPGRSRVLVDDRNLEIFELENQRAWIETNGSWEFWGEDIYFSSYSFEVHGSVVSRLKPHAGAQRIVSQDSDSFTVFTYQPASGGAPEPRLLVRAASGRFVVDPERGQRTDLLDFWDFDISSSGRWMTGKSATQQQFEVLNWTTTERFSMAEWPSYQERPRWRPGHDEVWIGGNDDTILVWPMGSEPRTVDGRLEYFSDDGRFFFREDKGPAGSQRYVGLADTPGGPTYAVTPPGTHNLYRPVIAGNWVIAELWLDDEGSRFDYAAVDPTTGQSQTLAVKGRLIAASATRLLAYANWDDGRNSGELALFDLASGAKTVLADGVYAASLDPGFHLAPQPNTDRLAAGTRVAFLVRHRFASPYDGLWVTELP